MALQGVCTRLPKPQGYCKPDVCLYTGALTEHPKAVMSQMMITVTIYPDAVFLKGHFAHAMVKDI
jgi:hypothetical protein